MSLKNHALLSLLPLLLCSCVQKMGIEGHLRPEGGEPAQLLTPRRPPEGTVAQDSAPAFSSPIPAQNPYKITHELLTRGREQFGIYCMPCHGMSGYGDGMIVQRGFLAPPSYHQDRLRNAPDSHFYDVISNGYNAMYAYGDRVSPENRWAIVAYIRALQLSQNARPADLSAEELRKAKEGSSP